MDVNNIEDVLNLSAILSSNGCEDAAHQPYLIAALIDWADSRSTGEGSVLAPESATPAPKAKRGKATETKESVGYAPKGEGFTPTPDPSEPDF